ncbi:hypothetical protein ACFWVP_02895 [Streptomyces sp. NPDC058637]|uniref:hypothetical protein n=1 Tax=Streptomyces sp. NPDC058637 TaxID=3346569 RepID=UPI00364F349E
MRLPVPDLLVPAGSTAKEFLVGDADGLRALFFPVPDKDFACVRPHFDIVLEPVAGNDGKVDVVVNAHTLVRDLLLQADRLGPHAAADQGLTTLLPGEQVRIRVDGCGTATVDDVRAALFCADTK